MDWKFAYAILSQDLELVRDSLEDPEVNHQGQLYYDNGPNFNLFGIKKCISPFEIGCEFGQLDVIKLLVNEYGIDISLHDNAALCRACRQGHIDIFKYIISHPDFKSDEHSCSIAFISANGNAHVVSLLLSEPRINPADQNNQAIIYAAYGGHVEIVKLLLADPRVNSADQNNLAIN